MSFAIMVSGSDICINFARFELTVSIEKPATEQFSKTIPKQMQRMQAEEVLDNTPLDDDNRRLILLLLLLLLLIVALMLGQLLP